MEFYPVVFESENTPASWFWVSGFGFRVSGFEFQVSGFGFRVQGSGYRVRVHR